MFERLRRQGIDEEETRRLLGCVIAAELFDIAQTKEPFDLEAIREEAFNAA